MLVVSTGKVGSVCYVVGYNEGCCVKYRFLFFIFILLIGVNNVNTCAL